MRKTLPRILVPLVALLCLPLFNLRWAWARDPKPDAKPPAGRELYELRAAQKKLGFGGSEVDTVVVIRFNAETGESWCLTGFDNSRNSAKWEKIKDPKPVAAGNYDVMCVAPWKDTDGDAFRIDRATGITWKFILSINGKGFEGKWEEVPEP